MDNNLVWLRPLLMPLALLYRGISRIRNEFYDRGWFASYASALPVMSVGNLTVGGNGKTPLCLYLIEELQARGWKPVILSRGYGGTQKGPHRVREEDSPSVVGDEPLLIARASGVPVVIARSRVEGARRIERDNLGDVIVLDDGFQHRRLKRDLDILSMFAGTEQAIVAFVQGDMLPLGRFREDRDIGLRRASLLVVSERSVLPQGTDVPALDERILRIVPASVPIFRSYYEFIEIRTLTGEPVITPRTVHGFAGIANPQGFFESLRRVGYSVERTHEFPDHHPFSEDELAALIRDNPGALFVCTEKDAVKIRGMSERVRCSFAEFRVRLKVVPSDAFMVAIERSLPGRSSRQ